MRHSLHAVLLPAALALGAVSAGCGGSGDGLPRRAISGVVTLDGAPLESGTIQFQPQQAGEFATAVGAVITDGAYAISREQGPVPGTYQVGIYSASDEALTEEMPGGLPPLRKEPIPPRYNTETTLSISVTEDGPTTFDFDLESE